MDEKKFDPRKLNKLNNPNRLKDIPPNLIFKFIDFSRIKVALDIGAGTGFFAKHFSSYLEGSLIIALDISFDLLQWMRDHVCSVNKNIIPVKMDEYNLPVKSNSVDLVYMINLHHELDDPIKMLNETKRVMKENGILLIVDWKKDYNLEGPPAHLKYEVQEVIIQIEKVGYKKVTKVIDLPKHFVIIAENNLE